MSGAGRPAWTFSNLFWKNTVNWNILNIGASALLRWPLLPRKLGYRHAYGQTGCLVYLVVCTGSNVSLATKTTSAKAVTCMLC